MINNVWASLREGYTEPVRDVLWGHIYLTPALAELTMSAPFTRLTRIFQLGPAFTVYPGATHTRFSHSIGVYHLARRLLINLAERGAAAWLSAEGVKSFLCACLLHDLGHFPFTHSLKELPLRSHESLTASFILAEPLKSLVGAAGADPYVTAAIVNKDEDNNAAAVGTETGFYQKLLSGCMDPDKLDYLNRDARYCGVPYGAQDVDFILSRLYPHRERGIDIDSKGIPSVESILFSKYLMYRSVYWHRQVRASTAMVKKALLGGLRDGVIKAEELYSLDDQGLFSLMAGRNYPLFALADRVRNGQLYAVAAEFPFDEDAHRALDDIEARSRYEADLAAKLSERGSRINADEIIIDVPEPVTFETGLFVTDESRCFAESSSVFKPETVRDFARSLRIVRLFVNPVHENTVKSQFKLADMLNIRYN
jgi:HD superfamily phosphohydrolase